MDISVIIPTCSEKAPLEACLRSLAHQSLAPSRYEILVVNNGGPRHSDRFLKPLLAPFSGRARLIETGGNLGFAGGCRAGVEASQGEFLAFHNDDSIADPAWLALAWAEMKASSDVAVAASRIVNVDGPTLQHEGVIQTHPHGLFWQVGWGTPDTVNARKDSRAGDGDIPAGPRIPSRPPATHSRDVDFFSGCVWMTPRAIWEEVGALSTAYHPGYYEDTEYGLRCRQLGYRIRVLLSATCGHHGSATLEYGSGKFWVTFHRSRYLFLARNLTGCTLGETLRSEAAWWRDHHAGHAALPCLAGLLSALPAMPRALLNRRRFRKRLAR
ncbi:MAG: hypothetical protein GHCLOJNM_01049 [bacterium]|nr:hypothetical protein [bacterium]